MCGMLSRKIRLIARFRSSSKAVAWGIPCRTGRGAVGLEREGNESREAAGLILQFSQAAQVIDAVMGTLDMAVQHGARAVPAHLMPGAVHLGPLLGTLLATANLVANLGIEDLCSAARDGPETVFPKKLQRLAKWNS